MDRMSEGPLNDRPTPADPPRLRAGDHDYRAFVGPPERYDLIAAMTFNLLTTLGLREHHRVLDIGCGSLRVGRLLIPYLRPGHYTGIEPNQWLVEEGIGRETGRDLIALKEPRFLFAAGAAELAPEARFDYVFAQSIFSHCGLDLIERWLRDVHPRLESDGLFVATFFPGLEDSACRGWSYPANVRYRTATIAALAREVGFAFRLLDWTHPAQQWVLLSKDGYDAGWLDGPDKLSWNLMAERFQLRRGSTRPRP